MKRSLMVFSLVVLLLCTATAGGTNELGTLFQKGRMVINGFEYYNDDVELYLGSASLQLSLTEALALAMNPKNATLTEAVITISGLEAYSYYEDILVKQDALSLHVKGNVNTKVFDEEYFFEHIDADFRIQEVVVELEGFRVSLPEGEMSIQDFSFDFIGDIKPSLFL